MIEDLKRIVVIVQEGTVTRAAEKLFVTQPAVSQSIRRVEQQLGIKLFRAQGKKLLLTQNGKEALIVIERIVMFWESLLQKESMLGKQIYTIGMYDNAALLLSSLFKKYFDKQSLALEIIIDNSEKLLSQLSYGVVDVCVCIYDDEKVLPQAVKLLRVFDEELVPVSSQKQQKDIQHIPFILYNRDSITRKYIDKAFIKHAIKPYVIAESTNPNFIKELALWGSGVALLPRNFVKSELEQKKLYKLSLPFHFKRPVAIYHNTTKTNKELNKLIEEMITLLT